MSPPLLEALPYAPDSHRLLESLLDLPGAVLLDSAGAGRFDILAADPVAWLETRGEETVIRGAGGERRVRGDPFDIARELLGPPVAPHPDLPFAGGLIGWLGYDLARRIEALPTLARDAEALPEMMLGLYDWAVVVDHRERRTVLASAAAPPPAPGRWRALGARLRAPGPAPKLAPARLAAPLAVNLDREAYLRRCARIARYIRDGDCYQVNLARRFEAPLQGHPWTLYRRLRRLNPGPFCAYLGFPGAAVLSSSPERFVALRGATAETRPIKGTCARGASPAEDAALAEALRASPKERAENVMIVDLLRNDLGRVCRPGSIHVPELCAVERYATVQHLVSTVRGTLAPGRDAFDLLRGCFPGGSITGAPKVRAMEIIEELEPHRRGVYCGAIGYLGFDGAMDTNIAIRTMVVSGGTVRFWSGGGIVADSAPEAELAETEHKAAALRRALAETAAPVAPRTVPPGEEGRRPAVGAPLGARPPGGDRGG